MPSSRGRLTAAGLAVAAALVAGCILNLPLAQTGQAAPPAITGLHVQGNQLLNGSGQPIRLLGVDRSGTEYACIQGWGIFDGPSDAASVQAIASWHTNAVRVPLNEDCWLGINGAPAAYSGAAYQQAIASYVGLLNAQGLVAILDLHWTAPGGQQATGQQPMPDQDHAPTFWQQVAGAYANNSSVIFDLFNEPHPDSNQDTTAAWTCWRDGGTCPGISYQVAGVQELVSAVRNAGATNVVMVGGVQYANALSQWLTYEPSDPAGNLAASWHVYHFNACNATACYDSTAGPVAQQVPLIAGEIGENDCAHDFIDPLMGWLDQHGQSYLGWTWDTWDCKSGPALIADYGGAPTQTFGQGFHDHLAALAAGPTPTPTSAPSPPPISYSFEDGTTEGWAASGAPLTGVSNSTKRAFDGQHSLAIAASRFTASQYPWVQVAPPSSLGAGTTITARAWAPAGSALRAQLFVSDANWSWHMEGYVSLRPGGRTTLTYAVPSGIAAPFHELGVQFQNSGSSAFSGTLYLDAVQ